MKTTAIFVLGLLLAACSSSNAPLDPKTVFSGEVTNVVVEVDYMNGWEPYVGDAEDGKPLWNFLQSNIEALFEGSSKNVEVPTQLSEMEEIPAKGEDYTSEEILDLALQYRDIPPLDGETAGIYILFLDGYFEEDGEQKKETLGVSIGHEGVIAVFKPVIATSSLVPSVRNFVEQSVLIHEAGHTLGLVNNGLPLTSEHQDEAHGKHCNNDQCVMYYLNEGAADLVEFLSHGNPSTESIIYGPECLADALAANGS